MAQVTKPIILDETGQDIVDAISALNTTTYTNLNNKPRINNIELSGNKAGYEVGLQDLLVNQTNIKSINNQSILGSGNISISADAAWGNITGNMADQADLTNALVNLNTSVSNLQSSKENKLTGGKLTAVNSGITSSKVATYDNYAITLSSLTNRVEEVNNNIDAKINTLDSSVTAATGKALTGITITNGKLESTITEITVPTNTNQLTNGAGFVNSAGVSSIVDAAIAQKLTDSVVIHTAQDNLSYSGDTVTLTTSYKNLNTGTSNTKTETIHLANSTTAGLMSPSDVNTLSDHGSRISALEGTTNRVLYVINSTLGPIGSYPIAFTIKGVVYSISGSVITEHNGASPEPTYTMDAQGNVTIHGIAYTFDVANMHGERAATQSNIGQFALNEGFVSPFRGVAIVVEETFHIWRYYPNTEGGSIIGWKDDGQDTVSAFTNTTPGIIQGSATDGKVYAENDGTGSVYGWSTLKDRVTAVENRPTNVMTFTSGTVLPATGSIGQMFFNTSNNLVYVYNGTAFMAINTYQ